MAAPTVWPQLAQTDDVLVWLSGSEALLVEDIKRRPFVQLAQLRIAVTWNTLAGVFDASPTRQHSRCGMFCKLLAVAFKWASNTVKWRWHLELSWSPHATLVRVRKRSVSRTALVSEATAKEGNDDAFSDCKLCRGDDASKRAMAQATAIYSRQQPRVTPEA